ncbi:MAG: hypothetical protein WC809_10435 [Sinimarinibacterium sp.]|jgi:hypothetical protein
MYRFLAFLLLLPFAASAEPAPHFQPQAFLAGHCWKGSFPDGKRADEHCFEWVYGGKFLRDRHVVSGGSYGGETIYFWDADAKAVHYLYFNTDGGVSHGSVTAREDGALLFPEEHYRKKDVEEIYRSSWRRDGDDAYLVLAEFQTPEGWKEAWHMRMLRQAPAKAE